MSRLPLSFGNTQQRWSKSTVTVTGLENMKYSLHAIPIEVLALAFIEFVFVSTLAAVLWYMFGHK